MEDPQWAEQLGEQAVADRPIEVYPPQGWGDYTQGLIPWRPRKLRFENPPQVGPMAPPRHDRETGLVHLPVDMASSPEEAMRIMAHELRHADRPEDSEEQIIAFDHFLKSKPILRD